MCKIAVFSINGINDLPSQCVVILVVKHLRAGRVFYGYENTTLPVVCSSRIDKANSGLNTDSNAQTESGLTNSCEIVSMNIAKG
jgi:hypothetical protein